MSWAKTIWLTPAKTIDESKKVWRLVSPHSIPKIPNAMPKGKTPICKGNSCMQPFLNSEILDIIKIILSDIYIIYGYLEIYIINNIT